MKVVKKLSKPNFKKVLSLLKELYPDADCALNFSNPFELLVATILSAQCTDIRVNQVTETLFRKYTSVKDFAESDLAELEQDIKSTGFYRNKALSIQSTARDILLKYQGEVPETLEQLIQLKGVGRKTASVVMGNAFGHVEGIVVDTHVSRLSQRLGLTQAQTPEKIEQDLMRLVEKSDWILFPHLLISHGRAVCKARKPFCQGCTLNILCPTP